VDHFQISELTKFADIEGAYNVTPLGNLAPEELVRARECVARAEAMAREAGRAFDVLPFVREVLAGERKALRGLFEISPGPDGNLRLKRGSAYLQRIDDAGRSRLERQLPGSAPLGAGMTRNCVLPWTEAQLWASTGVAPCCVYKDVTLYGEAGLTGALNSPGFVEIRQGLLTGNLVPGCATCTMYDAVPSAHLAERVASLS
jgi:hypothetical protein